MTDHARIKYTELTEDQKHKMEEMKKAGNAFIESIEAIGNTRESSLAKTNAEQAVMWASKAITS